MSPNNTVDGRVSGDKHISKPAKLDVNFLSLNPIQPNSWYDEHGPTVNYCPLRRKVRPTSYRIKVCSAKLDYTSSDTENEDKESGVDPIRPDSTHQWTRSDRAEHLLNANFISQIIIKDI